MPRAPKPCARCDRIVSGGRTYCTNCQPAHTWTSHPSANARTLTREDRRRFRAVVLARDTYCPCGARATEADHITPVSRGGSSDPHTNGRGLCKPCHDAKTRAEGRTR